jgi:hypothetical protein
MRWARTTRRAYLVPAKGEVEVNGVKLNARDGAAIAQEDVVTVKALGRRDRPGGRGLVDETQIIGSICPAEQSSVGRPA